MGGGRGPSDDCCAWVVAFSLARALASQNQLLVAGETPALRLVGRRYDWRGIGELAICRWPLARLQFPAWCL